MQNKTMLTVHTEITMCIPDIHWMVYFIILIADGLASTGCQAISNLHAELIEW